MRRGASSRSAWKVRAADAKEVGVGNPAEETYCHPNKMTVRQRYWFCQPIMGPLFSWSALDISITLVMVWLSQSPVPETKALVVPANALNL